MCKKFLVLAVWLIYFKTDLVGAVKDLPSFWPRCYRNDPDLNNCLLKTTEEIRPYLRKGIPELRLPSLTPLYIPEIKRAYSANLFNYTGVLKDLYISGLDTYKYVKIEADIKNLEFLTVVEFGPIHGTADYSMVGEILSVPVNAKGKLNVTAIGGKRTVRHKASTVIRNGVIYLKPVSTEVELDFENVTHDVPGLFEDNPALEKAITESFEALAEEVKRVVKPATEKLLADLLNDYLRNNLYKIPFDKLLPVRE